MPGLGRIAQFDERNMRYQIPTLAPELDYVYYSHFSWLFNQRNTGTCVGHGWLHWRMYPPVSFRIFSHEIVNGESLNAQALAIYREACKRDVWPQNDTGDLTFGTSVLAAAKALADPNGPFAVNGQAPISEYLWSYHLIPMVNWLLSRKGVVVIGVNWYEGMFEPTKEGFIKVGGRIAGGHCVVVDGVNRKRGVVRIANSWGNRWGQRGRAYMSFEDMERLIHENGEVCTAIERKL